MNKGQKQVFWVAFIFYLVIAVGCVKKASAEDVINPTFAKPNVAGDFLVVFPGGSPRILAGLGYSVARFFDILEIKAEITTKTDAVPTLVGPIVAIDVISAVQKLGGKITLPVGIRPTVGGGCLVDFSHQFKPYGALYGGIKYEF